MAKVTINRQAFHALRTSEPVKEDLQRRGRAIAAAAGPGFEARPSRGRNRARVVVVPTTDEARRKSITEMAPVRALNAGRN